MDREQIALKLGMDILGIPVTLRDRQKIYNALYKLQQRGVSLTRDELVYDRFEKCVRPPVLYEGYEGPRGLFWDILAIEADLAQGFDYFVGWKLDPERLREICQLRDDIAAGKVKLESISS